MSRFSLGKESLDFVIEFPQQFGNVRRRVTEVGGRRKIGMVAWVLCKFQMARMERRGLKVVVQFD